MYDLTIDFGPFKLLFLCYSQYILKHVPSLLNFMKTWNKPTYDFDLKERYLPVEQMVYFNRAGFVGFSLLRRCI